MPPSVAETTKMRASGSAVGRQSYRHLAHFHLQNRSFDHNFAGQLHASGLQIHFINCIFCETTQTAMKVLGRSLEEKLTNEGKNGVSDIAMVPRHGIFLNSTPETVTHNQIISFPQLIHKWHQMKQIVAVIGVGHYDIFSFGFCKASSQCTAISFIFNINNMCAL